MPKENLKKVGVFNHFIQTVLFSSIFTFTSNIGGIRRAFESSIQAILFPIAIAPDAIASLLALIRFTIAKNKNLGKTFDLIFIPTKMALVFTAVFAAISLVAVHSLFLIAIGSGMLYHTALAVYNLYQYLKTNRNSPTSLNLRSLYKENVIRNAISSLVGGIIVLGILTTMVFAPYLSASILTIAGIGTAAMLILTNTYTLYRHFRQSKTQTIANEEMPLYNNDYNNDPNGQRINSKTYYYRKFRPEYLTGNLENDKEFLTKEIDEKIQALSNEIASSRGTASEFFWSENSKRQAKIDHLKNLTSYVSSLSLETARPQKRVPQEQIQLATFEEKIFNSPPKATFQSFFRCVGDTEDITEAAKKYAEIYTNQPLQINCSVSRSNSGASNYGYS